MAFTLWYSVLWYLVLLCWRCGILSCLLDEVVFCPICLVFFLICSWRCVLWCSIMFSLYLVFTLFWIVRFCHHSLITQTKQFAKFHGERTESIRNILAVRWKSTVGGDNVFCSCLSVWYGCLSVYLSENVQELLPLVSLVYMILTLIYYLMLADTNT